MISFFALNLSCLNAGGRVIYSMGRHGLFHQSTGDSHEKNETPHVAVLIMGGLSFLLPTICVLRGMAPLDVFNDAGTLAAFGFLLPYILVSVAAPVYLKAIGQMKPWHIGLAVASLALLTIPAVGSVYPVPPAPVKYFPYLFLAYLIIGGAWIRFRHSRLPATAGFAPELVGSQDA
jgi:amino acid transporter